MPLKILGVYYEKTLIFEYISESKSHIDNVLSPTNAWSWLSAYDMQGYPHLLFVNLWEISSIFQS